MSWRKKIFTENYSLIYARKSFTCMKIMMPLCLSSLLPSLDQEFLFLYSQYHYFCTSFSLLIFLQTWNCFWHQLLDISSEHIKYRPKVYFILKCVSVWSHIIMSHSTLSSPTHPDIVELINNEKLYLTQTYQFVFDMNGKIDNLPKNVPVFIFFKRHFPLTLPKRCRTL